MRKHPDKSRRKRSVKPVQKKAVRTLKKPLSSKVHIKSNSQKATEKSISKKTISKKAISKKAVSKKIISKKAIPKKALPEKKSEAMHSKQKKENPKNPRQKNATSKNVPAGHGIEIQNMEEELNSLKALLKEKRKGGVDTFVDEMKLLTIPPKIELLKIQFYEKTCSDVSETLSDVRASLESAKPEPTILDMPVVDETGKNPFEHLRKDESALPLSEDAKNYREELGKKRISFSGIRESIKESFSNLFRKRGGK